MLTIVRRLFGHHSGGFVAVIAAAATFIANGLFDASNWIYAGLGVVVAGAAHLAGWTQRATQITAAAKTRIDNWLHTAAALAPPAVAAALGGIESAADASSVAVLALIAFVHQITVAASHVNAPTLTPSS